MKKRTSIRCRKAVSTVRKSQASMLAACARRKARQDEWLRSGAGRRPPASSTFRTEVADTEMPKPFEFADDPSVSPVRVLVVEPQDQTAYRRLKQRPTGSPMRIRPAARDELAVPAQQRLGLDREGRPSGSRQGAAQRCQQPPICPRQLRLPSLP